MIVVVFVSKVKNLNNDVGINLPEKCFQIKFIPFVSNFLPETVHWRSCVRARIHLKRFIHGPIVLNIYVKPMRSKYARRSRSESKIFMFSSELHVRCTYLCTKQMFNDRS